MAQCNLTATSGNGSAERQYIGARYVPQFFENPNGTWDWLQGVAYEPLTIVQYAENSYTSKKKVPANVGSPNLNPEYWAQTGNYNGITNNLQEQINDVNTTLPTLNKIKVLLIGDSYADGSGASSPELSYSNQLKTLIESWGGTFNFVGKGSTGFVGHNSQGYTFQNMLENAPEDDYTLILVQGFLNDVNNNQTGLRSGMENAVNSFSKVAHTKYPKAQIWCLPIGKTTLYTVKPWYLQLKELVGQSGMGWINEAFFILYATNTLADDNMHPSDIGHTVIARNLGSLIFGGNILPALMERNNVTVSMFGNTTEYTILWEQIKVWLGEEWSNGMSFTVPQTSLGIQANIDWEYLAYDGVANAILKFTFVNEKGILKGYLNSWSEAKSGTTANISANDNLHFVTNTWNYTIG